MKTGYIESSYDPRDYDADNNLIMTEPLPKVFSWKTSDKNLRVLDQGDSSMCVPYSLSVVVKMIKNIDINKNIIYRKRKNPDIDGMTIKDGMGVIRDMYMKDYKYFRIRNIICAKYNLINNGPFIFALPVMDPTISAFWKGDKYEGGHAIACIGYNEEGFILQNSWGKRWGDNGCCVLRYDEFNRYVIEAWGIG